MKRYLSKSGICPLDGDERIITATYEGGPYGMDQGGGVKTGFRCSRPYNLPECANCELGKSLPDEI